MRPGYDRFRIRERASVKILLADDERELRQALIAILSHAGYEVEGAADGEEALYDAKTSAFDLIILDIMMPKMDGLTVLRKLRQVGMSLSSCSRPGLISMTAWLASMPARTTIS